MDEITLQEKQQDHLSKIKEDYSHKMIAMQFYSAFLNKYRFVVEQEGEELITNFIWQHIYNLIYQDDEKKIYCDAEFQDYFLAYVSSYVYDYDLINEEAIADLIMRRYTEYDLLYIKEGKTPEEAFAATLVKEYETPDYLMNDIGPSYSKFDSKIYRDAGRYIRKNLNYFSQYTMMDDESLKYTLSQLCNPKNKQFTSFFESEIPQVLISYDNRIKLSIPNLLLASTGLFIKWQRDKVIIN